MGNCLHLAVEPVELLLTGEHVADICVVCLAEVKMSVDGPIAVCYDHDLVCCEEFGGKVRWQTCRICGWQTTRRVR